MNINDTPAEAAFRAQVRDWIAARVPANLKGLRNSNVSVPQLSREELWPLRELIAAEGWIVPELPREVGGAGLDAMQTIILNEEMFDAGVPIVEARAPGTGNICQILNRWGTAEQKARFLTPTLQGRIYWCQGYSEPGAGSDLASLQLRAVRDGDAYVLNGQKIWTSQAHRADAIFLLARTDPDAPRRQQGISFFIFDMKLPGIEVRPLVTIDGIHHFNETFFNDVRVPLDGLVGAENQGWTVAKALLVHERLNAPGAHPQVLALALDMLKGDARRAATPGGTAWTDAGLRRCVAAEEMESDCLRYTRYRALTRIARGEQPGDETQFFKYVGSELFQRVLATHERDVFGPAGVAWEDEPFGRHVRELVRSNATNRARTIAGGTSEVQRNVTAKRVLGLPD